ncbi:MAG: SDR family oxidoreductase [Alphaproteobacteria bacterium]
MALSVLFIGGTGQISLPAVHEAVARGHKVSVLNRGRTATDLPDGVTTIIGDMSDTATYARLGRDTYDVVCQFRAYTPEQVERDIATFTGRTGQYVFISSASAYQKPARHYIITEETPLENPYWEYSRNKIACEQLLRDQSELAYTIVRPSHTVRTGLPLAIGDGDAVARRLLRNAPVIVHGDGTSLWTVTRSRDFVVPFVRLFANPGALGEDFQITNDRAFTWDEITNAIADGLGVEANIVHVPTDTLVRYHQAWEGPLNGDKSWSALFDNAKVKELVGPFACVADLATILEESLDNFRARNSTASQAPHELDPLMDRIAAGQAALGHN